MAVSRQSSSGIAPIVFGLITVLGLLACCAGAGIFVWQCVGLFGGGIWRPMPVTALFGLAELPFSASPDGGGLIPWLLDLPAAAATTAIGLLLLLLAALRLASRAIADERRTIRQHYETRGRGRRN